MRKIKTSEANKGVVFSLTKNKYNFKDDRTIAQIAIAYSLQRNKKFDLENPPETDNRGKEYPESLLGEINRQSNDGVYKAIINQHYGKRLNEEEFTKLTKLHLDHGLDILNKDILQNNKGKNAHIDYLLSIINNGVSLVSSTPISTTHSEQREIGAFTGLLEIELGKDAKTGEPVKIKINDENEFDSQHFAVAGMNGSGKTELIKDVLYQINQQSKDELKFIFFDYKGEGKSDKLKTFLNATNCEFINIQEAPLKFNPLSSISLSNERQRQMDVMAFRDNLCAVDRKLGPKQKGSLSKAINRSFEETAKTGNAPSMVEVHNKLIEYYEESKIKEDSLTQIMGEISSIIFDNEYDGDFSFIDRNLYINLPGNLPEVARKASVFLMLNYLLNYFISANDVKPSPDRIKPIRYIIVIDEAHAYLKEKNMAGVLEKLLRMIRSKGVIVMMLSQGVEEYKQRDFDFSSQVKIPILLNVQNKDIKTAKSFLGTPKSEHPMKDALKKLESQKGVINFDEPKLIDINMFWQREI